MLALAREVGHQPVDRAGLAQVGLDCARIAKLGRERVKPVLAPGDKYQPLALRRQLAGEIDPQPADAPVISATGCDRSLSQQTVALTILPGSRGGSPTGRASTCSMPLSTWPQTVY